MLPERATCRTRVWDHGRVFRPRKSVSIDSTSPADSPQIDKLHKIVKNKSGLVATNKLVKAYVTKESVQQFTSLIDVKRRHFTAHPNLEPDVMLRKLFLIRRAAHERGDLNALGGAHLSIQLALAVTGAVKAKELLDKWKAAGSAGWGGFVAEDLLPYDDLLEGSE